MRRPSLLLVLAATSVLALVLAPLAFLVPATLEGDAASRWARLDGIVLDRLVDSLVLATGATLLSLLIALPLVWALHRRDFPGRRLLGVLYVAPLLIPPHIHTIAWLRIFGNRGYLSGFLNEKLGWDFDVRHGFFEVGGSPTFFPGATGILASAFWPLAALVISAGFRQLDPRHEEAALLAGGRRRAFLGVTVPLLRPHLLAGAFFVFLFAITCYGVPALLDTPTIMIEVFFVSSRIDSATAAVVALPLVAACFVALALATFGAGPKVWDPRSVRAGEVPGSLRRRSLPAGALAWGIVLLSAGWPISALLIRAGGLETYQSIWRNVHEDLAASLQLAFLAGLCIAVFGTLVGVFCSGIGRRRGFAVEALALVTVALPAIVIAVAANLFWGRAAGWGPIDVFVYRGLGLPLLVYLTLFLPFGIRAVRVTLARTSARQVEAARVAGRGRAAIFGRVVLPSLLPGVVAAGLLGFILTLGELVAGLVVNPEQWQTVQARIFNMIHFARDEEVAALCVLVAFMALLPTALYAVVFNRRVEVL